MEEKRVEYKAKIKDMPEEDRWKLESAIESLTTAHSFEELQEEINEVDRIITRAREVEHLEVETKLQKLKGLVQNHIEKGKAESKLLIVIRAFSKIAGQDKVHRRKDGFLGVDWVPYEIKDVSYDFRMRYGIVDDRYPRFTCDKQLLDKEETADFISPGHPLMEAVIDKIMEKYGNSLNEGTVFEDPDGQLYGLIWFLGGSVYDGNGVFIGKKMFSAYSPERGEIKRISPAVLWDLKPSKKEADDNVKDLLTFRPKVLSVVIRGALEDYRGMLLKERERAIKEPTLYVIQNPAELNPEEMVGIVRYLLKRGEWKRIAMQAG